MAQINLPRVILGGIVAGIVINVCEGLLNGVIFASQWGAEMTRLNLPASPSTKTLIALNVWGFAVGILTVWLYAAIRPRFGAGPKTAMLAGMIVWFSSYALASAVPVFLHIYRAELAATAVAIEIIEMLIAGVAGAYFYKEDSAPVPVTSAASA